ncbi:MAG: hypothetical protein AB1351_11570 [Thermoproteota archaeon]
MSTNRPTKGNDKKDPLQIKVSREPAVFEFSKDPLLQRKIELVCDGLDNGMMRLFLELKEDNKHLLGVYRRHDRT